MSTIKHYSCRSEQLATAIDEMHDWLVQQLITVNSKQLRLTVYCSKQYMDVQSYQRLLPEFRQRLLSGPNQQLQFEVIEHGPHKIAMEINMSQSWLDKTLSGIKDMFREQDGTSPPHEANIKNNDPIVSNKVVIKNEQGRYFPIQQGIELACRQLMQTVRSHISIAPEDMLVIRQIQVRGIDELSKTLLSEFEREFGAAQRTNYINRILQAQHASNSVLLQDLSVEILHDNNKIQLDEFECVTQALNNNEATEGVDVQLFGVWELRPQTVKAPEPEVVMSATPVVTPTAEPLAKVVLTVFDGQNPNGQTIEITQFPCVMGKLPQLDLVLNGTFISSRHAILDYNEQSGLSLFDSGSTNGTWLNEQFEKLPPHQNHPLKAGDKIRLAAKLSENKEFGEAPKLHIVAIHSKNQNELGATPVISPVSANTCTPILITKLAVLNIQDANGSQQISIDHCPFNIGRALDQHYVVPQANPNISGKHLEIMSIQNGTAKVNNLAANKNGIAKKTALNELLPAEFNWQFGETIVLAPKDLHSAVSITLQPA